MIYISTVSKRGASHPDWNEDNFYYKQTDRAIIGGVFDGCSSGKDSYFASKLFANVYKTTINKMKVDISFDSFPKVVEQFFENLYKAINLIELDMEETLSTAVLFFYETGSQRLLVKFFGDGVAYSNPGKLEICNNDESNMPDYLGYSLTEIIEEHSFHAYWNRKKSFSTRTKDFSISTDGIFSFKKIDDKEPDFDITSYIAQDTFLYKNPAALKRKLNMIRNKGYEHDDDVTVIRVLNDE